MKRILKTLFATLLTSTLVQFAAFGGPLEISNQYTRDIGKQVEEQPVAQTATSDLMPGQDLYESRCFACHSLDANRIGPRHSGLFGRQAGSLPDYDYSQALVDSQVVWDEATLDRWLENPEAFIPGQRMNYRLGDAADRAAIIAYLKQATR